MNEDNKGSIIDANSLLPLIEEVKKVFMETNF